MKKNLFIAGHRGLVGSALLRSLDNNKYKPIIRTHDQLDLTDQRAVNYFFDYNKIDEVIIAAGKVGGIHANKTYPAEFIYKNMMIVANCVHAAYKSGVKKLLFLGSSCIYPKHSIIPITEDQLLSGALEPTNEPYAIAKIDGIKLCETYRNQYGVDYHSIMPCNLYGINDNYDLENSHVIPGLIRRFHLAKIKKEPSITLWGTGKPFREFLNSEDLAKAAYKVLDVQAPPSIINVGSGTDISIKDLAYIIKEVVQYEGEIIFDDTKPDGTFKKTMDNSLIRTFGWQPQIDMKDGLHLAYNDFQKI